MIVQTDTFLSHLQVNRMSEDRVYTNAKARRMLGFTPAYSLERAIRQTVRYNLARGHISRHAVSPTVLCALICLLCLFLLRLLSHVLF